MPVTLHSRPVPISPTPTRKQRGAHRKAAARHTADLLRHIPFDLDTRLLSTLPAPPPVQPAPRQNAGQASMQSGVHPPLLLPCYHASPIAPAAPRYSSCAPYSMRGGVYEPSGAYQTPRTPPPSPSPVLSPAAPASILPSTVEKIGLSPSEHATLTSSNSSTDASTALAGVHVHIPSAWGEGLEVALDAVHTPSRNDLLPPASVAGHQGVEKKKVRFTPEPQGGTLRDEILAARERKREALEKAGSVIGLPGPAAWEEERHKGRDREGGE